MADAAQRRMTVEEFLAWHSGGNTRYQLRNGTPVAMAPPSLAHGNVVSNLMFGMRTALQRRPECSVVPETGIRSRSNARSFHVADIAVTCAPIPPSSAEMDAPILLVEVLSPSTSDDDRDIKLPDYRTIDSVREIVLISSRRRTCEVHRRGEDGRWTVDLLRRPDDRLRLDSVGLEMALADVYANVPLEEAS